MAFIPKFEEAQRVACKASIMIEGLTGKGKSGMALALAFVLSGGDWSKVFDVDTENKSANLFVGIPSDFGPAFGKFKVGQLTSDIGFAPGNYLTYREEAIKQGALTVIEDSISHAWNYKGGVLDLVNIAKTKSTHFAKDKYAAWSDEDVVREKNALLDLIRDARVHVITTVRVKEKFEYGTDDKGKSTLVSLGEQQIQQDDLKYEPDLVLHMLRPGSNKGNVIQHPKAKIIKSRYAIFNEGEEYEFTPALMEQLRDYLAEGVDPKELLEKQRQDYIAGMKDYLDKHPNAVPIWKVMKESAGHPDTKLNDMPLDVLKQCYIKITTD